MDRYEFQDAGTNKFWEVGVDAATLTVRYGKVGTAGQSKEKVFASAELASKERDKLVREKTGKGYVAAAPSSSPAPKPSAPAKGASKPADGAAPAADDSRLLAQVTDAFLAVLQSQLANAVDLKPVRAKAVKDSFESLAKLWPHGDPEHWMQIALELPAEHVLHRAAAEIVGRAVLPFHPWVTISAEPQPARYIEHVLPSRVLPVVYALEQEVPVISVWSIESGAHLEDLPLPVKKTVRPRILRERSDGTLHCFCSEANVFLERKPGGAFKPLRSAADAELSNRFVAYDADLSTLVRSNKDYDDWGGSRPWSLLVYRPEQGETTRLTAPFSHDHSWLWRGDSLIVHGSIEDTPGSFIAIIDLTTLGTKRIELSTPSRGALQWIDEARGIAGLEIVTESWGDYVEIDLDAGTVTAAAPGARLPRGTPTPPPLRDGTAYTRYFVHPKANEPCVGLHEAAQRYFVGANMLAGARFTPRVIVPYGAAFEKPNTKTSAKAAGPAPLAWAKPGTRLVYEIVDYDSSDTWTFEVLEAGDELVLRVHTVPAGTEENIEVASSLRFTSAALESAATPISFSQRHADVDVTISQKNRIAPVLVARALHRKLASGKGTPWKSEWTDAGKLVGSKGLGQVQLGEKETSVATLECESAETGTRVVLLDDATWPLVLVRDEGECSLQLVSIQLGTG